MHFRLLLPHQRFFTSLVFATVAHSAPSLGKPHVGTTTRTDSCGVAWQLAKADLVMVKDLEPWNWEAEEEQRRMVRFWVRCCELPTDALGAYNQLRDR